MVYFKAKLAEEIGHTEDIRADNIYWFGFRSSAYPVLLRFTLFLSLSPLLFPRSPLFSSLSSFAFVFPPLFPFPSQYLFVSSFTSSFSLLCFLFYLPLPPRFSVYLPFLPRFSLYFLFFLFYIILYNSLLPPFPSLFPSTSFFTSAFSSCHSYYPRVKGRMIFKEN